MPNSTHVIEFNRGYVGSKDRSDLGNGELKQATGVYYKPNDKRAHKIGGRTSFDAMAGAGKVKGVALLKYDSGGTDRLVATEGTKLWSATPGTTGTLADTSESLDTNSTTLVAAHSDNDWYLCNEWACSLPMSLWQ